MKLKYFALQLHIVVQVLKTPFATGIEIKCEYEENNHYSSYGCKIKKIIDDQTGIFGIHQEGKTDGDVIIVDGTHMYPNPKINTFDSSICKKFTNLEIISIAAKIEAFTEDAFLKCGAMLKRLYISNGEFYEIPRKITFKNTELTSLAFDNCQISTLPDDLLVNQKKIQEISFDGNKIKVLPRNIFRHLSGLTTLILSENEIHVLNPHVFRDLVSLKGISLATNKINILPSNIFDSCINLETIILKENKFKSINPNLFKNLQKLEALDMSRNKISAIRMNDLQHLTNLEELYLNENRIENLEENCFKFLRKLTSFGIGDNKIADLPPNIFSQLQNLQELGLNNNQLTTLYSDSFGIMENLNTLHVGGNKIAAFDEKIIDNTVLIYLDMYGNICCAESRINKVDIKTKLGKCFENYQPRAITGGLPTAISGEVVSNSCGKQVMGLVTIVNGTQIKRGSFPWIAALLRDNGDFLCGGTLVSNKRVITAAHCIEEKFFDIKLRPRDVIVFLGVHNLKKYAEIGRITAAVRNIRIHPDWHPGIQSYDADIAVLELAREVQFDEFIQPICLAQPQSQAALISLGVVVGFGKSELADVESVARMVNTPIYSYRTCVESSSHESLLSHRTICGGYANGTGVCIGDSGSGLIVKYNGAYYLRGIVSVSLRGELYGCNVDTYSVFTDVTKFYDWILDPERN